MFSFCLRDFRRKGGQITNMEFPCALESVLEALLQNHHIHSWKVTSEGINPCVVLRLKPCNDTKERVITQAYRRKPQSQIERDRRRAAEHKNRLERDNVSNSHTGLDSFGHDVNPKCVGSSGIDISSRHKKTDLHDCANGSSCVQPHNKLDPAREVSLGQARAPSPVPAAPRAAPGDDAKMVTSLGGGRGGGSEGSDESEGSEGSDTACSDTEDLFTNSADKGITTQHCEDNRRRSPPLPSDQGRCSKTGTADNGGWVKPRRDSLCIRLPRVTQQRCQS